MVDEPGGWPPTPRALILTVYGLYARERDGWLPVAGLIRLMAAAGVGESAVRSSIARLKRRGVLVSRRVEGAAGYALSADALAMLSEGDRRIFGRPKARYEEDGWVLAIFSVPESDRARRHELRSHLSRLGFGAVSPGVWIAPGALAAETADMLGRSSLDQYVQLFTGEPVDLAELPRKLADWWDLPRIRHAYTAYLRRWRPVLDRWQAESGDTAAAFADYVHTVTDWRRLPYLDPGLPVALLPADWEADDAADLFVALHHRLAAPSHEFATHASSSPDRRSLT